MLKSELKEPISRPLSNLELDDLLKLRVVVARIGEIDLAKWWNTRGQLGRYGAAALRRGFPRTHRFAQARSVFAVARARCEELFNPPHSVTLWSLPQSIEEEFDARWEQWLDHAVEWEPFFKEIEETRSTDLLAEIQRLRLPVAGDAAIVSKLRRSADGRAVQLPGHFAGTIADIELMALAFARGDVGSLAVPYMRLADG